MTDLQLSLHMDVDQKVMARDNRSFSAIVLLVRYVVAQVTIGIESTNLTRRSAHLCY